MHVAAENHGSKLTHWRNIKFTIVSILKMLMLDWCTMWGAITQLQVCIMHTGCDDGQVALFRPFY